MQKPSECNQRRREEKRFHFFKIIHSTQDPCMVIPTKFIRIFGKELSNRVVLKVPSSKEWDVELKEEEGQVSFRNGFQELMEYYSIGRGHFLMFRYEGNSQFSVVICDMSASEISYPCEDADEIQEEDCVVFKQTDVRQKKRKSFFDSKAQSSQQNLVATSRPVSLLDIKKAIREAKAFNSKYPVCYVRMRPSYVIYHFKLNLPMNFARKHLQGNPPNITLQVSDGRMWHVNCYCGISFFRLIKGWREFVKDNQLLEDDICIFELVDEENWELKVSIIHARKDSKQKDKTSDKAISQNHNAICQNQGKKNDLKRKKIRLTDAEDTKKKRSEKLSSVVDQEAKDMAVVRMPYDNPVEERSSKDYKTFTSEHPFCPVRMQRSYVTDKFYLNIRKDFAESYLKDAFRGIDLTIPNGEKKWHIPYNVDHHKLSWKAFVVDNPLKERDVCIFELVDREKVELRVSIFPAHPLDM